MEKLIASLLADKYAWIQLVPFLLIMKKSGKNENTEENIMPTVQINGQRIIEALIIALVPAGVLWGVMTSTIDQLKQNQVQMAGTMTNIQTSMHQMELKMNGINQSTIDGIKKQLAEIDKRLYLIEETDAGK